MIGILSILTLACADAPQTFQTKNLDTFADIFVDFNNELKYYSSLPQQQKNQFINQIVPYININQNQVKEAGVAAQNDFKITGMQVDYMAKFFHQIIELAKGQMKSVFQFVAVVKSVIPIYKAICQKAGSFESMPNYNQFKHIYDHFKNNICPKLPKMMEQMKSYDFSKLQNTIGIADGFLQYMKQGAVEFIQRLKSAPELQ